MKQRPISEAKPMAGWKTLPIQECGELLVPIGLHSAYPMVATDAIYAGETTASPYARDELKGSLLTVFVRKGVAERLKRASLLLPRRHMLLVWDAYRPQAVQQELFETYVNTLVEQGSNREQAREDAQRFVSIPSTDPGSPPPHNTGGAVDLTIICFSKESWGWVTNPGTTEEDRGALIRECSTPLPMGTVFDAVQPETRTRFFEERRTVQLTAEEIEARNNRRLLWNVMVASGFSNYSEEWWHFDFGNQFHAARTKCSAVYAAAPFSEENLGWEQMRRHHQRDKRRSSHPVAARF